MLFQLSIVLSLYIMFISFLLCHLMDTDHDFVSWWLCILSWINKSIKPYKDNKTLESGSDHSTCQMLVFLTLTSPQHQKVCVKQSWALDKITQHPFLAQTLGDLFTFYSTTVFVSSYLKLPRSYTLMQFNTKTLSHMTIDNFSLGKSAVQHNQQLLQTELMLALFWNSWEAKWGTDLQKNASSLLLLNIHERLRRSSLVDSDGDIYKNACNCQFTNGIYFNTTDITILKQPFKWDECSSGLPTCFLT